MMKKVSHIAASIALAASASFAGEFSEAMQEMGESALQGYTKPFATGMGMGMNSQWSYSSKTQSFLGLPVGVSVYMGYPIVTVDKKMKTFDLEGNLPVGALIEEFNLPAGMSLSQMASMVSASTGKTYELNNIGINAQDLPTIYGSNKKAARTRAISDVITNDSTGFLGLIHDYNTFADTLNSQLGRDSLSKVSIPDSIELPFRGFNASVAPSLPPIGVHLGFSHIPFVDNISLGARYASSSLLPGFVGEKFEEKLGTIDQFGLTVQHEITPHIPVLGSLPFLHFGLFYAYNNLTIDAKEIAKMEFHNNIYMLTASADAKFLVGLGVYGGVGYEFSNLNVTTQEREVIAGVTLPALNVDIEGASGLRTQLGARFSFAVFDVYGDISWGETTVYNAGLAIGLNGL